MHWKKLGLVFSPKGDLWWRQSYADCPTPEMVDSETIRIYYGTRCKKNISRIGCVDVSAKDPTKIVRDHEKIILNKGINGCFDDAGVHPSSILNLGELKLLYYFGFENCVKVPYRILSGACFSRKFPIFKRVRKYPFLDRSDGGLYVRSTPFLMLEGYKIRLWYISGGKWISDGKLKPTYTVYHNYFNELYRKPIKCLKLDKPDEFGIARPWIMKKKHLYMMVYSIRTVSKGYRLGYAESRDGIKWIRRDGKLNLDVSKKGWDSEMMCFPSVIKCKYGTYLFYNGNDYGKEGFGCAELL